MFTICSLFVVGSFFHLLCFHEYNAHVSFDPKLTIHVQVLAASCFIILSLIFVNCSMLFAGSFLNICFSHQYVVTHYPQSHVSFDPDLTAYSMSE